jgi:hypothetical protein
MKFRVKNTVIRALALADTSLTRLTSRHDLEALLLSLRPRLVDQAMTRMGPKGDGGYLVPDDLVGIEACFSPGVAMSSGFERDCADLGMRVFMADGSVDGPAESHESFRFTKRNLGATSTDDVMTLDQWVEDSLPNPGSDLILQIDIEGAEYETLLSASDSLMRRFRIIVAEFHELDKLLSRPFFGFAKATFAKICQTHVCVHIHPNNCCGSVKAVGLEIPRVTEFTFLRKDRIHNEVFARTFPHPLDHDNTANPSIPLPECWY